MKKTPEEEFFNEVSKAIEAKDTDAMEVLMADEPEEKQEELIQEVAAETEKVEETEVATTEVLETEVDEKDSVIAKLTKELEDLKTINHKIKSDVGRVPGLQSKLAELDKKLQTMAERSADTAHNAEDDASLKDAFDTEDFNVIRETDPLLAKAIESTLKRLTLSSRKENVETVRQVTSTFREEVETATAAEEVDKLTEAMPEAWDIFKSRDWQYFKNSISPETRAKAESYLAADVIEALTEFKAWNKPYGAADTTQSSQNTEESTKTTEERNRKLSVKVPGSNSVAPAQPKADDATTLFNQIYEETLKSYHRR